MTSTRIDLESKALSAPHRAALLLSTMLLVGLGAASPALADHGYRNGPGVVIQAGFPLPFLFPLPIPVPVPVPVFRVPVVRQPYYGGGHHVHGRNCGHYRGYDRRYYRGAAYRGDWDDHGKRGRHGKHDKHNKHKKHKKHGKKHKRGH